MQGEFLLRPSPAWSFFSQPARYRSPLFVSLYIMMPSNDLDMEHAAHQVVCQEFLLRQAISATIDENLYTWLGPILKHPNSALKRDYAQLLNLAVTACGPVVLKPDPESQTPLRQLADASRSLHTRLRGIEGKRSRWLPSQDLEDLEDATEAADRLALTAEALNHVLGYLPTEDSWVPTFQSLAQRIPSARPGRDHWKDLQSQWTLPQIAPDSACPEQSPTTRSEPELADRVRSINWSFLMDESEPEETLVATIPVFWETYTAAKSHDETRDEPDSPWAS